MQRLRVPARSLLGLQGDVVPEDGGEGLVPKQLADVFQRLGSLAEMEPREESAEQVRVACNPDCPSSNALRQAGFAAIGVSGPSGFEVKRLGGGSSSVVA
jgi:hypothetical protein